MYYLFSFMIIDEYFNFVFQAASYLTDPICKAHECFRRIFVVDALNPADSLLVNLSRKLFLGFSAFVFALSAIFTTLPGVALRGTATHLQSEPYIYQKGAFINQRLSQDLTFTLLSWNVCFVGGGYSITDGGVVPWEDRIDAIIEQIIAKDADVNCIYETYDTRSAIYLAQKLKERGYAHCYFDIGAKTIGVSSGILIASKYEVKNPEFTLFPIDTLVGRTKNAAKGVFAFDLASEGKSFARIFSTHLQHSEEPEFPTADELAGRKSQMEIIMSKVNQVEDLCVVVTGDLNLDDGEYLASEWSHRFEKGDEFEGKTWGGDGFCAKLIDSSKRISNPLNLDHTMVLKGTAQNIRTTVVETGFDGAQFNKDALSDHKGLYSEITLSSFIFPQNEV